MRVKKSCNIYYVQINFFTSHLPSNEVEYFNNTISIKLILKYFYAVLSEYLKEWKFNYKLTQTYYDAGYQKFKKRNKILNLNILVNKVINIRKHKRNVIEYS